MLLLCLTSWYQTRLSLYAVLLELTNIIEKKIGKISKNYLFVCHNRATKRPDIFSYLLYRFW